MSVIHMFYLISEARCFAVAMSSRVTFTTLYDGPRPLQWNLSPFAPPCVYHMQHESLPHQTAPLFQKPLNINQCADPQLLHHNLTTYYHCPSVLLWSLVQRETWDTLHLMTPPLMCLTVIPSLEVPGVCVDYSYTPIPMFSSYAYKFIHSDNVSRMENKVQ